MLRQNADAIVFATFKLANARELPGEAASEAATIAAAGRTVAVFNPHVAAGVVHGSPGGSAPALLPGVTRTSQARMASSWGAMVSNTSLAPGR